MTSFAIDKNVPLPAKTRPGGRPALYPLADMQDGDSFLIPATTREKAHAAMLRAAKRVGCGVVTAVEGDGVRVWRVAPPPPRSVKPAASENAGLTD